MLPNQAAPPGFGEFFIVLRRRTRAGQVCVVIPEKDAAGQEKLKQAVANLVAHPAPAKK